MQASDAKFSFVVSNHLGRNIAGNNFVSAGNAGKDADRKALEGLAVFVGELAVDYGFWNQLDDNCGNVWGDVDEYSLTGIVARRGIREIAGLGSLENCWAKWKRVKLETPFRIAQDSGRRVGHKLHECVADGLVCDGIEDCAAEWAGAGILIGRKLLGRERGGKQEVNGGEEKYFADEEFLGNGSGWAVPGTGVRHEGLGYLV